MALRNASNRIAGGSFDVKLPPVTNDEIGELTGSFQTVIDHLRAYTGEMESLAYVDQMTRVKNKAAFCNLKMDIDEMIKDGLCVSHLSYATLIILRSLTTYRASGGRRGFNHHG